MSRLILEWQTYGQGLTMHGGNKVLWWIMVEMQLYDKVCWLKEFCMVMMILECLSYGLVLFCK